MEFGVLGALEVRHDGSPVELRAGLPRTILCLLLLRRGETVTADYLIDALWPEHAPVHPANALQTQISYLRKRLTSGEVGGPIVTRPRGYALEVEPDRLDSWRFESAVAVAATADRSDRDELRRSFDALGRALALWRGDAYADVADQEFARGEVIRLQELRLAASELRNDLALELGMHRDLTAAIASQISDNPLRERLHHQLMLALYRSGRQAEALRAFTSARAVLVDELGIEPGPELRELENRILAQDPALLLPDGEDRTPAPLQAAPAEAPADEPPPATDIVSPIAEPAPAAPATGSARLPAEITRLVGRGLEVDRVATLLSTSRIVTLTGPGGAGKSRLAIEVARRHERTERVWFVDLASVADPANVAPIIAHGMGFAVPPGEDAARALAGCLGRSRGLLVLDTCEHLVGAVATVVSSIARDTDDVHVLATSRRPLSIAGEMAWPIPPLGMAPPGSDLDALGASPAIELFVERARAVRPDFELTAENAPHVAAICMALDALPLAIELAASRVDVLSPQAIESRLRRRFDLLVDGARDAAVRQRSLRSALEWSIGLLEEDERVFFANLGVFAGSFELDAVLAVGGVDELRTLDLLTSLVRNSMVAPVGSDRYRLLDTLAVYAAEMLDGLDGETAGRNHAEHYLNRCEAAALGLQTADQPAWLRRLREDRANHRVAFDWFLDHGDAPSAAKLVTSLRWFYTLDSMSEYGHAQMSRLLEHPELGPRDRARLLGSLALMSSLRLMMDRAEELAREATELARSCGDSAEESFGLSMIALAQGMRGDFAASHVTLAGALDPDRPEQHTWESALALALATRAVVEVRTPDMYETAKRALAAAARVGDTHLNALGNRHLALASMYDGDPAVAAAHARHAVAFSELTESVEGTFGSLHVLGLALEAGDDLDGARSAHLASLELAARGALVVGQCDAVDSLARVAFARHDHDCALRLLTASEARRAELLLPPARDHLGRLSAIRDLDRVPNDGDSTAFDELVDELLVHRRSPVTAS